LLKKDEVDAFIDTFKEPAKSVMDTVVHHGKKIAREYEEKMEAERNR